MCLLSSSFGYFPPLLPQGGFRRFSYSLLSGVFRSMCLKSYGVAAKRGRMIQKVALAVRPASVVDPEAKPPPRMSCLSCVSERERGAI